MALTVNTNMPSLNAQRNVNKTQGALQKSLERLSSGLRINSAKDDAAGMAISNRMGSQIRGLDQAVRNANDGISLAQTAEGALGQVTTNLQRLRELAVQSANASNSTDDRKALQDEAKQLLDEIDRTASQTEFNGTRLLDGSFKAANFQIGANAGQTLSIDIGSAKLDKLGVSNAAALTAQGGSSAINEGDLIVNGVAIRSSSAADDTASYPSSSKASSAIAKAAAVNASSNQTGVTAKADVNVLEGASMTAGADDGTLTLNGVDIAIDTSADAASSRAAVVEAVNKVSGQTGVMATDTGTDEGGVTLSAADGRNITVKFSKAGLDAKTGIQGSDTETTRYGSYTLTSDKEIVVTGGAGATADVANAGLTAGTYRSQTAYTSSTTNNGTALQSGDVKINGVLVGASSAKSDTYSSGGTVAASAIAKSAAINAISDKTGVTATANATVTGPVDMSTSNADGIGTITINGVATRTISVVDISPVGATPEEKAILAADNRSTVVSAINALSEQTGVTAVDTNDIRTGIKLVAKDGRNITVSFGAGGLDQGNTGIEETTTYGTITLSSAAEFTIEKGTTDTMDNSGLVAGTYGSGKSGMALSDVDISTAEGATKALGAVDNALKQIDANRSSLGAVQNRFEATISNMSNVSENLSAARGRIIDADFAAETASLSKNQIMQQAGVAMLAQANQLPQQILSLLQG